ncbi:MAG TPA: hypothetical protein ENL20_08745 [Candidatus Cloacimonetes bacterium]|nr:hypothetical protein [Candidatus Cloacimonadota bacterium]
MKYKIILLLIIFLTTVFSHYYNKHKIIKYERESNRLIEIYNSKKDLNLNYLNINSKLCSRERIQKLAIEKLNMFYPDDTSNIHNIKIDNRKETFCLIDYIIPSAEALTK